QVDRTELHVCLHSPAGTPGKTCTILGRLPVSSSSEPFRQVPHQQALLWVAAPLPLLRCASYTSRRSTPVVAHPAMRERHSRGGSGWAGLRVPVSLVHGAR